MAPGRGIASRRYWVYARRVNEMRVTCSRRLSGVRSWLVSYSMALVVPSTRRTVSGYARAGALRSLCHSHSVGILG